MSKDKLEEGDILAVISLRKNGMQLSEIAKMYKVKPNAIVYWCKKHGLPTSDNTPTVLTEEQIDQIKDLKGQGKTNQEIANLLSLKFSTVRHASAKFKINAPDNLNATLKTKYTKEQELQVLSLKKELKTNQEIVEITGLTIGQVKRIVKNNNAGLTPEQRQQNALRGKLSKDPNALTKMQALAISPEANKKRSQTMQSKFEQNPDLANQMGKYSQTFWQNLKKEDFDSLIVKRQEIANESSKVQEYRKVLSQENGELNRKTINSFKNNNVTSYSELMQKYAQEHKGIYIGGYIDIYTKCDWQCSKGHPFKMRPGNVRMGQWCPQCSHTGPSKGQMEVYNFVKSLLPNEEVILCDRTQIKPKELDIYVPSKRLAIEYDGLMAHSNYYSDNNGRHLEKLEACNKAGIQLLAFFEDEWRNRQDIIKSIIKHKLGLSGAQKIRASKCTVRELTNSRDFAWFFDKYHLDGNAKSGSAFGLYYEEELVMCASLRVNFNRELEIARMATDSRYIVLGGFSKLLQHMPKPLVSFSNNKISVGNVYQKNGFKLIKENGANYWYTNFKDRHQRFKCRKPSQEHELYKHMPEAYLLTEEQLAAAGITSALLGFDKESWYRIEDYGHKKWLLT